MSIFVLFSGLVWFIVSLCGAYLWMIALAGARRFRPPRPAKGLARFAIAIPAHNEEGVIGQTVETLNKLDYPRDRFDIFVAADNCTDQTAKFGRERGAICYERQTIERSGKGAALNWLLERIFAKENYEAVVIFDADTQVDQNFLKVMNDCLESGGLVIQGKHVISNPHAGWFPALTWAMMAIDCRLFSNGRANLGLSARHMGDSICFKSEVLKELKLGSGLTEDYELRLRLLLEGISIQYEPRAVGCGQAPLRWQEAQAQRLRWARGAAEAGKSFRGKLLRLGLKRADWRLLDGFLSISLPSFSALTIISTLMMALSILFAAGSAPWLAWSWAAVLICLFLYPMFGLGLEGAPSWAYLAVLTGPVFMVWRSWINLTARLRAKNIAWVRTPHRG